MAAGLLPQEHVALERIFVVIPVHDRRDTTLACLESLANQSFVNRHIVVVDDGSTDGTAESIGKRFPSVKILTGDGDLWWTRAMNQGVRWALQTAGKNDYILSLNDDVSFEPDYISSLAEAAQSHPDSLIGSVALDEHGLCIVDAGVRINWLSAKYSHIGEGHLYSDLVNESKDVWAVDVLSGRGTLIPSELFRRTGFYNDQKLPHYGADYEFSLRAAKNGYQLLINAKSVLRSQIQATGVNNRIQSLTWRQLGKSFFMRRSPNCLRYRFNFARLAAPSHLFLPYVFFDISRVCIGNIRARVKKKQRA